MMEQRQQRREHDHGPTKGKRRAIYRQGTFSGNKWGIGSVFFII